MSIPVVDLADFLSGDAQRKAAFVESLGKAYEEVGINMDGDDIKIAFNAGYLMQVLGILTDDKATLHLSGALNPGLLRPGNGDGTPLDSDFLYVVMPMQV